MQIRMLEILIDRICLVLTRTSWVQAEELLHKMTPESIATFCRLVPKAYCEIYPALICVISENEENKEITESMQKEVEARAEDKKEKSAILQQGLKSMFLEKATCK